MVKVLYILKGTFHFIFSVHDFCSIYCFNQLMTQHSVFFCSCALSSCGLDTVHYSTIFEVLQRPRCWFRFLCKQASLCLFYVSQEHMDLEVQLQELQESIPKPRRFLSNSSLHKLINLQVITKKVIFDQQCTNSLMQFVVKGTALCPIDKDACVLYVWVDEKEKPSYGRAVVVQIPV